MNTSYGWRQTGEKNVVFVVPHGGDPAEKMIARSLEALRPLAVSLVVNTRMRRRVVNFNDCGRLRDSNKKAARAFWRDVKSTVGKALAAAPGAVYVYFVHNAESMLKRGSKLFPRREMPEGELVYSELKHKDPRPYDVDIGCGQTGLLPVNGYRPESLPELKSDFCHNLVLAETIYPRRGRGSKVTISPDKLFELIFLVKMLQPAWRVEVGREFAAQKRRI